MDVAERGGVRRVNEVVRTVHRAVVAASESCTWLDRRTVVAFTGPFVLYVLTLAPTVYNLDSAELTTAAATGGIVRATGYPLFLLLGRIWSNLPVGDVGYRMNLFSAWNGALTIVLAERILRRLDVDVWCALGSLGLLATAPLFWALSLIAEVYTLHTLMMAAVILALLWWSDNPSPARLALVGFLMGASAGNHAATILLVPGAVWYLLATAPTRVLEGRPLAWGTGGALAGLAVYLYLPFLQSKAPAFNYAGWYDAGGSFQPVDLQTVQGVWWLVSGQRFAGRLFAYGPVELWAETGRWAAGLWRAFLAVGIGPGVIGILRSRNRALGGLLLLTFLCSAGFFIGYRVIDKETMFLPTYLIWALWVGLGYQGLTAWMNREANDWLRRHGALLLRAAMVGAVIVAAVLNWRLVDLSDDWSARERGKRMLDAVAPDALILGWWETVPVIEYLQLVEGRRPDVTAINCFLMARDDVPALALAEVLQRPVYADDGARRMLDATWITTDGPLYRLWPHAPVRPPSGGD